MNNRDFTFGRSKNPGHGLMQEILCWVMNILSRGLDPESLQLIEAHKPCLRNVGEEEEEVTLVFNRDPCQQRVKPPFFSHQTVENSLLSEEKCASRSSLFSWGPTQKRLCLAVFLETPHMQNTRPQAPQRQGYPVSSMFSEDLVPWSAFVSATCGPPVGLVQSSICKLRSPPRWEWRSSDTLARTNPRSGAWLLEEGEGNM